MGRYLFSRLAQSIINIFFITILVFLLARASGDPATVLVPDGLPEEAVIALRERLGLDRPLHEQYARFLQGFVQGDLGDSITGHRPVLEMIVERFPATFSLAGAAMLVAMLMGIPLGVLSAVYRDSVIDRIAKVIAFLGQSTPPFWLAIMMILVFGVILYEAGLPSMPISGRGDLLTYIMPAIVMGWAAVAGLVRLTRSSMLDVLHSDYMTMARAKGLAEKVVIWKHALRNALIPVITYSGLILAAFMNGSVVVEQIFAWPGLGRLILTAVTSRDFPVVQGVVIVIGVMLIVINFLVDILYAFIDPRIRYTNT